MAISSPEYVGIIPQLSDRIDDDEDEGQEKREKEKKKVIRTVEDGLLIVVSARGGQNFPKSTEFRNSVVFRPFFGFPFPCFSVRVAESVS